MTANDTQIDVAERIPELIERLRSFEIDHGPDGWPAIRMRDVSALLDEIERLRGWIDGLADQQASDSPKPGVMVQIGSGRSVAAFPYDKF